MFDDDGFLIDWQQWQETVACEIANNEGIELSDSHWQIIHAVRDYYQAFDHSPPMRPLVKWLTQSLPEIQINSMYLLTLFPENPAKLISKIAGLPKPLGCL